MKHGSGGKGPEIQTSMKKEGGAAPDPSRRLGAALGGMDRWDASYTVSKEGPESCWGSVG